MKYEFIEIEKKEGQYIRACLNYEEALEKRPTLLILPGFTDNRLGSHYLYVQIAEYLVAQGMNVLRFDYFGTGESDGSFDQMNLSACVEDVKLVAAYSREHYATDLFFFGFSFGGLVATVAAPEVNPNKMALLAPAVEMAKLVEPYVENINKIRPNAEEIDHQGLMMKMSFYEDLLEYNALGYAQNYHGEVVIYRGSVDDLVNLESNQELADAFPNGEYISVRNGDHFIKSSFLRGEIFADLLEFLTTKRKGSIG